ncbi:hypothetical protein ACH4Y0_02800 [Streptomyces sp. NPDC020707]|uniref:hypothetical protein n=1 Tax=Streptomyces sp. NPDC020707 TaxID=3365084 RepID=UPI00379AA7CE
MRGMREQAREALGWERRDPARYNIDGIIRDAWVNGNGSTETWKTAVERNRYPFLVGDTVRVVVEINGFDEYLYGRISEFRTADNRSYRRRILNPHSACVDLFEWHSAAVRPLSQITPELEDFEIATDHDVVNKDGPAHNFGIFLCASGVHGGYAPPADVLVTDKRTGTQRRMCNDCNDPDQRARLGHLMWREREQCMDEIRHLTANPRTIAGPAGDVEADAARRLAYYFPYLVPAEAAELYKQWKEQHRVAA